MFRKSNLALLVGLTILHAAATLLSHLASLRITMFHDVIGQQLQDSERLVMSIRDVLLYPLFWSLSRIPFLAQFDSPAIGVAVILANSFIWAAVALGVVRLIASRRNRDIEHDAG